MVKGVYAIFLDDTPYVYVGQSQNIESRWLDHARQWVWPNKATYVVLQEKPRSTLTAAERRWQKKLKKLGYLLLSEPQQVWSARRTPESRRLAAIKAQETLRKNGWYNKRSGGETGKRGGLKTH